LIKLVELIDKSTARADMELQLLRNDSIH
jgi:hypothetical protein